MAYGYKVMRVEDLGDEGRGFRLKGGDKSVFLWNEDNVFYYDKETDAFIKKDSNDK